MGDEWEDYQRTKGEIASDCFLYGFIPSLCLAFDFSAIIVGIICLADGAGHDYSKCTGEEGEAIAGQPCLCQHVPVSGLALLVIGILLLAITRVPTYLNRERHKLQCVRR